MYIGRDIGGGVFSATRRANKRASHLRFLLGFRFRRKKGREKERGRKEREREKPTRRGRIDAYFERKCTDARLMHIYRAWPARGTLMQFSILWVSVRQAL